MFAKKSVRVTMTAAAMKSARASSVFLDVGPILIALRLKHATTTNASIHAALVSPNVASTPFVLRKITKLFVHVLQE